MCFGFSKSVSLVFESQWDFETKARARHVRSLSDLGHLVPTIGTHSSDTHSHSTSKAHALVEHKFTHLSRF